MGEEEGMLWEDDAVPAQDLHTIMSKILEPYLSIQEAGGFVWDLTYQGKVYKGIKFIPYVHMIKQNTDEADRLAGSYTSRGKNVSQLCPILPENLLPLSTPYDGHQSKKYW